MAFNLSVGDFNLPTGLRVIGRGYLVLDSIVFINFSNTLLMKWEPPSKITTLGMPYLGKDNGSEQFDNNLGITSRAGMASIHLDT
ncbi:unnamed protein product [Microthlaspi erraticum]|uniref:Uncharacterized protein n=1 Tax=Microthlaspi erraticum TaxID=1685480 RepID=A0A6D2ISZ5_9BRAS|nr:unnamed protein product [Microthlaspi erraticum]